MNSQKTIIFWLVLPLVALFVSWRAFQTLAPAHPVSKIEPVSVEREADRAALLRKAYESSYELGFVEGWAKLSNEDVLTIDDSLASDDHLLQVFIEQAEKDYQEFGVAKTDEEYRTMFVGALEYEMRRRGLVSRDLLEGKEVTQFASVEDYYAAGNPRLLSHRRGLPNFKRDVSERTKKQVKEHCGNCCEVCGSTRQLEVDHKIALMNGGSNIASNLGVLCDSCHTKKTRLDYKIRKQRQKVAGIR